MSTEYLQPVSWKQVQIEGGFWGPRIQTNREVTLDYQYEQMERTGRIDNFRRASGRKKGEYEGAFFNDSDVYKWLEAASYSLGVYPDKELENKVDKLIKEIASAQQEDGYLNTYFILKKEKRFTNLKDKHELYCAGHLFEAAVAHHKATGEKSLLNIATRFADLIYQIFGPGKREGTSGHPEIEIALMKLYWLTKNRCYLDTAKFFIDRRGKGLVGGNELQQDNIPFRKQKEIIGHAVRAVYLMSGAADVYRQTGDKTLMDALVRLWENTVQKKMYVTGGIGSRYKGEAFGEDYELPNDRAYAETCASIGSIFWNYRMLQLTKEAKYTDIMEKTLYNGFLSGVSLNGKRYFYQNPLQSNGTHQRANWFKTACCPPNIARLLASLGGYFYSISREGVWIHLYGESRATISLTRDRKIVLIQKTNYPWDGKINIKIFPDAQTSFTLFLRIPGWCQNVEISVNSKLIEEIPIPGSYFPLKREWIKGDNVQLNLSMSIDFLKMHPYSSNNGRLAISRGPLIYCIETADQPNIDIFNVLLPPDVKFSPHFEHNLLGEIIALQGNALLRDNFRWKEKLYRTYQNQGRTKAIPIKIIAVPYFTWANRKIGKMMVWIPIV